MITLPRSNTLPKQTPLPLYRDMATAGMPVTTQQTSIPSHNKHRHTQKQDNTTAWILGLGGLAITTGLGSLFWWKFRHKPNQSASKTAQATQTFNGLTEPIKNANFKGIQPKRTVAEVQDLCEEVMQVGNSGLACQTMSCINSIRFYKKLAETEADFDNRAYLQGVTDFLGADNNETLKNKAFQLCRTLFPNLYEQHLANNKINTEHEQPNSTVFMPHFLAQYVFATLGGAIEAFTVGHFKDTATILTNLCNGNIGLLGDYSRQHMVSLVGIREAEQGCIDKLIQILKEEDSTKIDLDLLAKIHLLTYNQLNNSQPFDAVCLKTIFKDSQGKYGFYLRVFEKEEPLNKPLEKWIVDYTNPPLFTEDITSQEFHERLMREGDAIFKPS